MEKTIFNTNVELKNKTQFNRLKKAILKAGLKIYSDVKFNSTSIQFHFNENADAFDCWLYKTREFEATETEFIELLKQYKNENRN